MSSSGKLLTTAFRHGAVFAKPTRSGTPPPPPAEAMARDHVPLRPHPATRAGDPGCTTQSKRLERERWGRSGSCPTNGNGMREVFSIKREFAPAAGSSRCAGDRAAAGASPSARGENHISCLTDNAGQENARTIPENAHNCFNLIADKR